MKIPVTQGDELVVESFDRTYNAGKTPGAVSGKPVKALRVTAGGLVDMSKGRVAMPRSATMQTAFTGVAAAGPVTLAGTVKGDVVVSVVNLTAPADASTLFETTVTVSGQLQQVSNTNQSAVKFLVLIQHQK